MSDHGEGPSPATFRRRFHQGEMLLGTFIKTPGVHTTEILGGLGFDFVVIDAEHAPFDRQAIDGALLAARAVGTAAIVRVAEPTPAHLLAALDDGATGVLVPHVSSAAAATAVARACRYRGGRRGFSNSPRAGNYGGLDIATHIETQDAGVTTIAMIEDPEAIEAIDDIVTVDGIDGFFVGRADLAVALGAAATADPRVQQASERIIAAARSVGKPVCIMVASKAEALAFRELGATSFIVSSDQGFMRQSAKQALSEFAPLRG